jgi:hypothetical protein
MLVHTRSSPSPHFPPSFATHDLVDRLGKDLDVVLVETGHGYTAVG